MYLQRGRRVSLARLIYSYVLQEKTMKVIANRHKTAVSVCYEDLVKNRKNNKQICSAIGLEYSPEMIEDHFRRNTSFESCEEKS